MSDDYLDGILAPLSDKNKKTMCSCGKQGSIRYDGGLPCGIHCDDCFIALVTDCRKRSW